MADRAKKLDYAESDLIYPNCVRSFKDENLKSSVKEIYDCVRSSHHILPRSIRSFDRHECPKKMLGKAKVRELMSMYLAQNVPKIGDLLNCQFTQLVEVSDIVALSVWAIQEGAVDPDVKTYASEMLGDVLSQLSLGRTGNVEHISRKISDNCSKAIGRIATKEFGLSAPVFTSAELTYRSRVRLLLAGC